MRLNTGAINDYLAIGNSFVLTAPCIGVDIGIANEQQSAFTYKLVSKVACIVPI